jgi:hypothetical protein
LLLLRFLFLVTGMHSGDESQENEETKDFVHKKVHYPGVQQKVRPRSSKFSEKAMQLQVLPSD